MPPVIIQGGMGVGVSSWQLARSVSLAGHLGVVSGTAMDVVLLRRLWDGDPGEHVRRALQACPLREAVEDILERFYRPAEEAGPEPYPNLPMHKQVLSLLQERLLAVGNFVEVYLAKEGHDNPVGVNLLTKIQMPTLASLYGAMLAGVDYVLMGAGIPREIPGVLDRLAENEPASLKLDVVDLPRGEEALMTFDAADHWVGEPPPLKRPDFLPIISSESLATMMHRKASGRVDGFIVEHHTAGGHNAPPRGRGELTDRGEPVYGDRDEANLEKVGSHGLPFWVAGGAGCPMKVQAAREAGAAGVQIGTLFAYCEESGLAAEYKSRVIAEALKRPVEVLTDGRASPTGFPFKVVELEDTLSEEQVYDARERVCDLGYLRHAYHMGNGRIGYRCPSEPVGTYVKKGGELDDTVGRKCICNGLLATIGHPQKRKDGAMEPPILTSGDELRELGAFLQGRTSYTAQDVIDHLLPEDRRRRLAAAAAAESAAAPTAAGTSA